MMRNIIFCLLLSLAAPVCVAPTVARAADGKILDRTVDKYMQEAAQWEPRIKQAATTMFWILATVSLVFTFAFLISKGNVGIGDFFGEFLRFIVTTGVFYWLLQNGSAIAQAVFRSFAQLGREASSSYQIDLSPSTIISFAMELVVKACSSFGEQDIATSCIALLLSIAIAVLFAIIAAMMVLLLCASWVLVYAGIIYLGFGGGRWTTDIAINYFKTVLGLGMQTFAFCLLVGIGQTEIENLVNDASQMKSVTVKGYVYDSVINTTTMTITEACVILIFTVVLFVLLRTVPQMLAGVVTGASAGGINLGNGVGGFAGAAIVSGGAMVAMQAAGAGLALNSAYQQTKEHKSSGEGMFKGASEEGGLSGAMSMGLRSAGDFMANLATGGGDSSKNAIQSSTTGGRVSANIDVKREEEKTAREAADAAKEAQEGSSPSSTSSAPVSSNDAGESISDTSAPIADNTINEQPVDSSGEDSFDWAGAIKAARTREDDEWDDAIKNHDPTKVGLVE